MIRERVLNSIYEERKSNSWHNPCEYPFDFHASEVGDCQRKLYFKRTIPFKPTRVIEASLLLFETGNFFHREIQRLFKDEEKEKEIKMSFKNFNIIGKADIVCGGVIYELKAVSTLPSLPYPHNEKQVECYMRGLKKETAFLVYVKKSTLETLEFEIKKNDIRWKEILNRCESVAIAVKEKNIPLGEFTPNCRYCSFYEQCRKLKYY
ncbi:MAG: Dna2/Cas4 domain-containing protein [Candidatus Pacearchaeota archaeon]